MASPLAVLSEAAHVYEQMEQLKMAEQLASSPVYSASAAESSSGQSNLPWVLVVPHPMAAAHAAHAQAAMAAAIQSNAWHLAAMAQQLPPEPPRNLVLQPAGSLSSGQQSLGSNESEGYPPWHTTDQNQPIKTPTIVRNPAHQPPKMRQKVVLRTKKGRSSVDSHFRRSLGFDTPVTLKKRPSSMIEHSEVDDHFNRVFGAEEWKKLQAKRKKLNRHSII